MSYHRNDRKCEPQDCEFYSYQESDSLRILRKFRDIYENELHKIDSKGGGDCLQAKINLQEQWIHDLTEQNEMMAKTVEKLECEATERVKMLEAKLKSNAECICEVMQRYSQLNDSLNLDEPFQKLFYFENDIKSLLEFIRRIREDHCWSIDGLKFYDVTHCDLFGSQQFCTTSTCPPTREKDETCVKKEEALEKHKEELSSLREITDKKDEELDHLKRMMAEGQTLLTVYQLNEKQDQIVNLRREIKITEERRLQNENQIELKDDIIKKLRKEVRQLKQQELEGYKQVIKIERDKSNLELSQMGSLDLQSENSRLKIEISEDRTRFKEHLKQKEELQVKLKEEKKEKENMVNILSQERQKNSGICSKNLKQIAELKQEIEQLKLDLEKTKKAKETLERKCNELEHELNDSKRRNSSLLDENSLIDEIKKKNKSLQDEVDDLSTTVIDQKNQLAILLNKTMKQDESEDLHTMKEKLLVQITELKLKIAELEIELADERDRRGEKTIICRGDPAKEIARISQVNQTDEIMDSDKHEATEESADEDENRQKRRCSKCRLKKEKTVQIQISKMQSQRDEILQTLITDNKEEHHCQTDIKSEEMQIMLENCQKRADNLQKAVDYYINSVTILEAAEEKAKIQIEEQKMTICALQEALVDAKRELDEFKRNNNEEIQQYQHVLEVLCSSVVELEEKRLNLCEEVSKITTTYKSLFDANFELEVKHINALQDLSLAETNLMKYQKKLRQVEGDICGLKTDLEKVRAEKQALREQVVFYQFEMKVLSERLLIVEDNLIVSNKSYEDEMARLIEAMACQQSTNEKLTSQLSTTEQQLLLEKQMGQQHIEELARLVYDKDVELGNYAESLEEVRNRLDESLQQNQLLQEEICMLNCKLVQMEDTMKMYEEDHVHHLKNNEACQSQVVCWEEKLRGLQKELEQKNEELNKLKDDYCNTYGVLMASQKEIVELKDALKERQQTVSELNKSLSELTSGNSKLMDELGVLKQNIEETAKKLAGKETEVVNYKQLVRGLKNNLIDLNKTLIQAEKDKASSSEVNHQLKKDEIASCLCDSESFISLEDDVAKLFAALRKQLLEKESLIQNLRQAVEKHNQSIAEKSEKDLQYEQEIEELAKKLQRSKQEERLLKCNVKKLQYDINTLQKELINRDDHIELLRNNLEQAKSKTAQETVSEEEMSALKNEINISLQKQRSLAQEKEKLLEQLSRTQKRAAELEEKNTMMKEQLQGYVMEIDSLQQDKELMARKNDQLHQDIQKLQNSLVNVKKHHRYNMDALQRELGEVRNNRDDISGESRHIIDNVRLWLVEQKSINQQASAKLKNYVEIIEDLQYEKSLLSQQLCEQLAKDGIEIPDSLNTPCRRRMYQPPRENRQSPCRYTNSLEEDEEPPRHFRQCRPIRCPSQRSLGSQGSSAGEEQGCDPCRLRCYGLPDWTSSSLMGSEVGDIIDDYDEEEFCLSRVQTMTEELNKTNRLWKAKMRDAEYRVTKDDK